MSGSTLVREPPVAESRRSGPKDDISVPLMMPDRTTHQDRNGQETAVEIIGLHKRFGDYVALDEINLEVRRGEFLTLLGPSGCGKTTLLNLIAGFFEPSAGMIRINGRDVTHLPPYRRTTGLVFQNYALFPHMSVFENIAFGLKMRRIATAEIKRRVAELIDVVRLAEHGYKRVHQLSGGQQQRVALARALVIQPDVLLLDEPLSALDKDLRSQMQVELKQIQTKLGVTTIFVTHDQGEALSLSDRIVVMNRGRMEQIATPSELYRKPASRFIASFIGQVNTISGTVVRDASGTMLRLDGGGAISGIEGQVSSLATGQRADLAVRPEDLHAVPPDVNDDDALRGIVAHLLYQGSHTLIFVATPALGTILLLERGDIIDRCAIGDSIRFRVNGEKAVLIPC